jgi:PAP2 superfamily
MPSVHVGWALIVAIAVITVSRSRWRWLAAAYPVLTLLVVVVTANHFWLDGIVAALLVVLVLVVQRKARRLRSGKSSERPQVRPAHGEISVRS